MIDFVREQGTFFRDESTVLGNCQVLLPGELETKKILSYQIAIKTRLEEIGSDQEVLDYEYYRSFIRRAVKIAPRFLLRRISIYPISDNLDEKVDPDEQNIRVTIPFPSDTCVSYIVFSSKIGDFFYPEESNCPYQTLVNAIRRGGLTKASSRFARNIVNRLQWNGELNGQNIADPIDVDFIIRTLRDFL